MRSEHSLYEAKAKLSALVRNVLEGGTVIITVHGEPAAELRPIAPANPNHSNEERGLISAISMAASHRISSSPSISAPFVETTVCHRESF